MISPGLCIDLETTLAGRIPDHVRPAGQKRYETRIIEIGAVLWHMPKKSFGCLVNPIPSNVLLQTASDLAVYLKKIHQKPENTIDFWSRVLVKRKSVNKRMLGMSPDKWLRYSSHQRMEYFVLWHNTPSKGPTFVSETEAMHRLNTFSEKHGVKVWFAHNGNSFDFKVLQGCALRTKQRLPSDVTYIDTLKLCRKAIPNLASYSQPILYKTLFKTSYNAHVAIDDAHALARICAHIHEKSQCPVPERKTRSQTKAQYSLPERTSDSLPKQKTRSQTKAQYSLPERTSDSLPERKTRSQTKAQYSLPEQTSDSLPERTSQKDMALSFRKRTKSTKKEMLLGFPSKRAISRKIAMALTFARRLK